jgi:hypothetical protein
LRKAALLLVGLSSFLGFALGVCALSRDAPELLFLAACNFEDGSAAGWSPNDPAHWRVAEKDGTKVYELTAPGEQGRIRAPTSWSLWSGHNVTSFEFRGRLRCYTDPANKYRDICVFFHFQDAEHFYYVHFAGTSDGVHNIIGLVDGADRVKINAEPAGTSVVRLTDTAWHEFKVVCDADSGEIRAYLDDLTAPILTACDRTLGHGLAGVGSFDDTGAFDDLELRGRLQTPAAHGRRSYFRWTSVVEAWAVGITTTSLMLTWAGRVAHQTTASAMSSGVSGSRP